MLQYLIKLGLDGRQATAEASRVSRSLEGIGSVARRMGGVLGGYFTTRAAISYFRGVSEYFSRINDTAARTGVSTDAIQALGFAAEQSGASLESVVTGLKNIARTSQEALDNPKSDVRASFARLGVTLEDLKRKSPEQIFRAMAQTIAGMPPSARATADALATMGRSADELMGVFRGGFAENLRTFAEMDLGLDKEAIARIDHLVDRLEAFAKVALKIGGEALAGAAPYLEAGLDMMQVHEAMKAVPYITPAFSFARFGEMAGRQTGIVSAVAQDVVAKTIAEELGKANSTLNSIDKKI